MKNVKVVLIDIDDTLLDFDLCADWSIQESAKQLKISLPENIFSVFWKINDSLWKELEKGNITNDALYIKRWDLTFEKLNIAYDGAAFDVVFRENLSKSGMHVKNAEALLEYLSSKYDVYTASNGPFIQQTTRMKLANLDKYIKGYFISEAIGYSKPTKQFFDGCLNTLTNVSKENCVMIGDSLSADMHGAHTYGMKCIWFNRVHETYESVIADYVVEDLLDIKKIL